MQAIFLSPSSQETSTVLLRVKSLGPRSQGSRSEGVCNGLTSAQYVKYPDKEARRALYWAVGRPHSRQSTELQSLVELDGRVGPVRQTVRCKRAGLETSAISSDLKLLPLGSLIASEQSATLAPLAS